MQEEKGIGEYEIYSDFVLPIYKNEIAGKDFVFHNPDEALSFFESIIRTSDISNLFNGHPPNESDPLTWHLLSIYEEYLEYQLFYTLYQDYKHKDKLMNNYILVRSGRHAENFILKWFNYFEKLGQLINHALGYPLNTKRIQNRNYCSYWKICNEIRKRLGNDPNSISTTIGYLYRINETPAYEKISEIRHDLVHIHMNMGNLAGFSIYGPIAERATGEGFDLPFDYDLMNEQLAKQPMAISGTGIRKINPPEKKPNLRITYRMGPKETENGKNGSYSIEEINALIEDATDLLVEIKHKVLEYGEETK